MTDFRARKRKSADYHQQYLAKNPNGYCGIGGCGVSYSMPEASV
jgi:peptide-methionine (S)-S-oxide reductase